MAKLDWRKLSKKWGTKGGISALMLEGAAQKGLILQPGQSLIQPGGVGAALGLTGAQLPGRFGGGFGGFRGRGVMDRQTSGDFQVARLSPTTGYRINMGG